MAVRTSSPPKRRLQLHQSEASPQGVRSGSERERVIVPMPSRHFADEVPVGGDDDGASI